MKGAISQIGVCSIESFQILVRSATSVKFRIKKINLSAILSNYAQFHIVLNQNVCILTLVRVSQNFYRQQSPNPRTQIGSSSDLRILNS